MNLSCDQPLDGFERRLLDELIAIDAQRPATVPTTDATTTLRTIRALERGGRSRRMRPALIGASLAILVTAGVFLGGRATTPTHGSVRSSGSGTGTGPAVAAGPATVNLRPAAFTLVKNSNGSVTFTVRELVFDSAAATKALNDAGITGRILNAATQTCGSPGSVPTGTLSAHVAGYKITIQSSMYKRGGGVLLIVAPVIDPSTKQLSIWIADKTYDHRGQIPTCVPAQ